MTDQTEKTDEQLIHSAEAALVEVEGIAKILANPNLTKAVDSLHRRLDRCLVRYNRDHAGENKVALLSGGDK